MDTPSSWEQTRLIAILRTLDLPYYDVENILEVSGNTISTAEKWLRGASFDEVETVIGVDKLQKLVNEVLTDTGIDPTELVRAARLTPDDILEHYRKDYPEHKKKTPKHFGEVESARYQDHQKAMLKLVERLKNDLNPDLSAPYIRELNDSKKGIGDIRFSYGLEFDENVETRIIRGYLEQHLNSSPYYWLMNDKDRGIPKWKGIGNEELYRRSKLLRGIDRETVRVTSMPVNKAGSVDYIGPSTWFSDSIFEAVVECMYQDLDYEVEPIDDHLFSVRFAAALIGRTETREEAYQYVDYHKHLKAKYKKSKMVKAINIIEEERHSITEDISEILTKFIVDNHIPGQCDYEFCG